MMEAEAPPKHKSVFIRLHDATSQKRTYHHENLKSHMVVKCLEMKMTLLKRAIDSILSH